jgi:hypothetical protein
MLKTWMPFAALLLLAAIFALVLACSSDDDDDNDTESPDDDGEVDDDDDNDDNDESPADDDTADDDTTDDDDDATPPECHTVIRGSLEWAQCDNGADIDHPGALSWAATLEIDGKTGWRLPKRAELQALYDAAREIDTDCFIPAHIADPFYLTCVWVWTSEYLAGFEGEVAWVVGFSQGTVTIQETVALINMRALAVRDL